MWKSIFRVSTPIQPLPHSFVLRPFLQWPLYIPPKPLLRPSRPLLWCMSTDCRCRDYNRPRKHASRDRIRGKSWCQLYPIWVTAFRAHQDNHGLGSSEGWEGWEVLYSETVWWVRRPLIYPAFSVRILYMYAIRGFFGCRGWVGLSWIILCWWGLRFCFRCVSLW